ncbi:MAG: single-stranded DNA-binding protein [Janthinobacterium lividum]
MLAHRGVGVGNRGAERHAGRGQQQEQVKEEAHGGERYGGVSRSAPIFAALRGLNKVILIGNLGKDPEVNVLDGNVPVAKFSLATTETWRDKSGQPQSSTDWHTVVLWRSLAELAQAYLRRGSLVYVEGKLKTRHYDDPATGQRRYVTEIIGEQVLMLDKKTGEMPPLDA